MPRKRSNKSLEEKFFDKIFYCFSGCWLWTNKPDAYGYGLFINENGKQVKAHRWSYEHFIGKIPDGLTIDHLCKIKCCVNPQHLDPKTAVDNAMCGSNVGATNARKTHCNYGHEFTEENTAYFLNRNGKRGRNCRICNRRRGKETYNRKRNNI